MNGLATMGDGTAFSLLSVIRDQCGFATRLDREHCSDGDRRWLVTAQGSDGQIWRSRHRNLLFAVVMLQKMLSDSFEQSTTLAVG
jgi:hypothetical protein